MQNVKPRAPSKLGEKDVESNFVCNHNLFDEPVVLPVGDVLDLHSFLPNDIPSVVEEFLEKCRRSGILHARLIHGKGAGVQRAIIRSLLDKHPTVISFQDAPAEAGGWGATIVSLAALYSSDIVNRSL